MNRITAFVLVGLLLLTSSAMAFDGQRKGFVLGGGLGFAPSIKTTGPGFFGDRVTTEESGVALNLLLGYAWDEQNMLVYEANAAGYSINQVTITQGLEGIVWYHYWGPMGKTIFTALGLGLYNYTVEDSNATRKTGIIIGVGYELARHWQAGLYISSGKTKAGGDELDHTTVSLLIGGVAF